MRLPEAGQGVDLPSRIGTLSPRRISAKLSKIHIDRISGLAISARSPKAYAGIERVLLETRG